MGNRGWYVGRERVVWLNKYSIDKEAIRNSMARPRGGGSPVEDRWSVGKGWWVWGGKDVVCGLGNRRSVG